MLAGVRVVAPPGPSKSVASSRSTATALMVMRERALGRSVGHRVHVQHVVASRAVDAVDDEKIIAGIDGAVEARHVGFRWVVEEVSVVAGDPDRACGGALVKVERRAPVRLSAPRG